MRMLCVDDEPLMLIMLEKAVREAAPDADISAFRYQEDLLEDAKKNGFAASVKFSPTPTKEMS